MLDLLPKTSESLFLFFSLFSLCCSNWVISIVLSPSSLILPSVFELIGCHVTLLLSHPLSFSFQLVYLSLLKFPLGFPVFISLLRLSISLLRHSLFPCMFIIAYWRIFMITTLKSRWEGQLHHSQARAKVKAAHLILRGIGLSLQGFL